MSAPAVRSADLSRDAFLALPLAEQYRHVRAFTETLTEPLATEDYVVQSHADVSPTKWHLAHTTWFWETFVLREYLDGYELYDEQYPFLFNSYYVQAGERHCRAQRGYLSRPTVAEVFAFRAHVDEAMQRLLADIPGDAESPLAEVVRVGLNHEQQHQELMVTDIKHVFSVNPLRPAYRERPHVPAPDPGPTRWVAFDEGLHEVGYLPERDGPFTFDNETPRHRVFVEKFALADRLVTCGEYLAFMEDGGYERAPLWLSEGFATVQEHGWTEPFYWEQRDGAWWHFTLAGMRPVDPNEPLTHISYFEADAYARWAGVRLPTEFEWEVASEGVPMTGQFCRGRPAAPDAAGAHRRGRRRAYRTAPPPALRRRVGVDAQPVLPVSRLPAAPRRARRVQRQVHVEPVRAARRELRDEPDPHPPDVPQLFPRRRDVAVHRHPAGERPVAPAPFPDGAALSGHAPHAPAHGLLFPAPARRRSRIRRPRDVPARCTDGSRRAAESDPVQVFLRRARVGALRPDHRDGGVLSDADRTRHHAGARRRDGRAHRAARGAHRIRQRLQPQNPRPARRTRRPRGLRPHRHLAGPPPRHGRVAARGLPRPPHSPRRRRLHGRLRPSRRSPTPASASSTSPARRSATSTGRRPPTFWPTQPRSRADRRGRAAGCSSAST